MQASLELDHLAASGLGVGMLYVANQSESKSASNQWDLGMEMTLGVISVGSTVPGKQPAEPSIFLCDFQEPSSWFQLWTSLALEDGNSGLGSLENLIRAWCCNNRWGWQEAKGNLRDRWSDLKM